MTNTKFRKRALLSSVAMLLVALVALGSATFAWFTENPVVSASGIDAYGQTSIGLKIKTTSDASQWKDSANFMNSTSIATHDPAYKLVLEPAYANFTESNSVKTLSNWLSAKADVATAWGATGNWQSGPSLVEAAASGMTLGNGIYHEQAKIKTTTGETAEVVLSALSVSAVQGAPTISNGVTVLVVVGGEIKAMAKVGSDAIKTYTSPSTSTSAEGEGSGTWAATTIPSAGISLGNAGAGINETSADTLIVDVYVYLDGTDDDVYTNNCSADQLIGGVSMTFAKATTP